MLSIFEELFLLALDEEKGNIVPFAKKTIAYGLSGAILAELALRGKISSNEKNRLDLIDPTPTGDEILDEILQEIRSTEKRRKLTYWVSQLSTRPKKLRERVGERLAAKNLLSQEDKRFFWKPFSTENGQPEVPSKFEMKGSLRAMILSRDENLESDHRSLALLNVAESSNLLNLIFTQDEVQLAKQRIHEKIIRAALENPAMQTVEELEQAVGTTIEDDSD